MKKLIFAASTALFAIALSINLNVNEDATSLIMSTDIEALTSGESGGQTCRCAFWGGNSVCAANNGGRECATFSGNGDCSQYNSNCGG